MKYPLDVEAEIKYLSKYFIEHGVISKPCVALTDDNRVVIAEFHIDQEIQDEKLVHNWYWMKLYDPVLHTDKFGTCILSSGRSVEVVEWQQINFNKLEKNNV